MQKQAETASVRMASQEAIEPTGASVHRPNVTNFSLCSP
jgi:hypothetical protein